MPATVTATLIAPNAIRYTWTGTAPYDVWQEGALVLSGTTLTEYIAQTTDGSTNPLPAIEVRDADDTGTAQNKAYSPRVRMQWRGQADAAVYIIQQYTGGEWVSRATVNEDRTGYYAFETTAHDDGDSAQWRVVPQDSGGYEGEPLGFTFAVVCNPMPPAVEYSYSSGTGLTVEAA